MITSIDFINKLRIEKSGLYKKFNSVEECIYSLIGIQSQYNQHSIINIFNRITDFKISKFDIKAKNTKIIKVWGQRLTLHIYLIKDWYLINQVFCDRDNWIKKYCRTLKVNIDDVLNKIYEAFDDKRVLSRTDLILACEMYPKELFQWGGILIQATLSGNIYGIVSLDDKKIFMHISSLENHKFDISNNCIQELILRYIKGYGPITIKDFKHWSGLKEYEFIDEFKNLTNKLVKLKVNEEEYYLEKFEYEKFKNTKLKKNRKVKLLGKFDNLLLAYFDKSWIIEKDFINKVWGKAGQVEAVILYNNKIIGTWRYKIINNKINFDILLFYNFKESIINQICKETERIADFFNVKIKNVSFN